MRWKAGRRIFATAIGGLLVTAALAQGTQGAKDKPTAPSVVRRDEVMKTKPAREVANALRSWDLETRPEAQARLHEVMGTMPKHTHPDADERIFVIEGEIQMELGDLNVTLKAGDYASIPRGTPHKILLPKGVARALVSGIHTPMADPKKTIWNEPAPVMK
jgi:quercetin dioxygenase-like cupin family protein